MNTEQRIEKLIARRTSKGHNAIESGRLLADLLSRHTGCNLVAALVYQGFATERDARSFIEAVGANGALPVGNPMPYPGAGILPGSKGDWI